MQVDKNNKNYYLSDDTVIVPDDRRSTVKQYVQRKQNFAVTMADSGLKSAKRKRFKGINNAS
jgi:hypothetical protein